MNLVVKQHVKAFVEAVIKDKCDYEGVRDDLLQDCTDEVKAEVLKLTSWMIYIDALRNRVDELCIDFNCDPEDLGFDDEMADALLAEWN